MVATTKRIVRSAIPEADWAEVEEGRQENRRDEAGRSGGLMDQHGRVSPCSTFVLEGKQKHGGGERDGYLLDQRTCAHCRIESRMGVARVIGEE